MDIVFEIFQLKEPDWTDDFNIALLSVGKVFTLNSYVTLFQFEFLKQF